MLKKNFFSKKISLTRLCFLILALCLLAWIYLRLASAGMSYEWQWNRVWRQFGHWTEAGFKSGPLCEGLLLTIGITISSIPISFFAGLALALMRLSPWQVCEKISLVHICVFRNTPLLLQLFFIYFLVAPLFNLSPFNSALLALCAFEGAYVAEILRAAILDVPRTQWEAALGLGFGLSQSFIMIILPQAIRIALPALINQGVSLLKDTSLVSAIAVADLTMRAQAVVAETFLAFEVWLLVGVIYIALSLCIALPGLFLEKRNFRK